MTPHAGDGNGVWLINIMSSIGYVPVKKVACGKKPGLALYADSFKYANLSVRFDELSEAQEVCD
jgi:hypothetical protein